MAVIEVAVGDSIRIGTREYRVRESGDRVALEAVEPLAPGIYVRKAHVKGSAAIAVRTDGTRVLLSGDTPSFREGRLVSWDSTVISALSASQIREDWDLVVPW